MKTGHRKEIEKAMKTGHRKEIEKAMKTGHRKEIEKAIDGALVGGFVLGAGGPGGRGW